MDVPLYLKFLRPRLINWVFRSCPDCQFGCPECGWSCPDFPTGPGLQRLRSRLSYHDAPVAHIAYPSYTRQMSSISTATRRGVSVTGEPGRSESAPGVIQTDGGTPVPPSLYGTGRVQAVRQELKPDLWKIAYQGVLRLVSQSETVRERWPGVRFLESEQNTVFRIL